MDFLHLSLYQCSPSDLSQTLGPYLGDRIRRGGKFPGGGQRLLTGDGKSGIFCLWAGDIRKGDDPAKMAFSMLVSAVLSVREVGAREAERLYLGLIAPVQWEQVILQTSLPILRSEGLSVGMCNLAYPHPIDVDPSTWFAESDMRGLNPSMDFLSAWTISISPGPL